MKTYNDEEIDALVEEIKEQYLAPLLAEAAQEVAKSEHGKKAPITGGSGLAIKGEHLGDENSAKAKSNKFTNWPVSKEESSMSKEESSMSSSSGSASSMSKDEGSASGVPPTMKEQSGGKQPLDAMPPTMKPHSGLGKDEHSPKEGSASPASASASGSDGDMGGDAPAADHAAPSAAAPAPAAAPMAPDQGAAMAPDQGAQGAGDMQSLKQAYAQLSPQDLQMHLMAAQEVCQEQAAQQAPQAAPGAGMGMGMPGAGAPEEKALAMSEKTNQEIEDLKKTVEGLTGVLEAVLSRGQSKSVKTMAEFVAKSEQDRPASVKNLSKSEIASKLTRVAQNPKLSKSDGDLVTRYFLNGDVSVSELEHLLK